MNPTIPGRRSAAIDDDAAVYSTLAAAKRALAADLMCDPATMARGLDAEYRMRPHLRVIGEAMAEVLAGLYNRLLILTPPQVGKPVYAGSMILMSDGSRKRIDEIDPGERVITHTGRPQTVLAVHRQGQQPTVKIATYGGRETIAAMDHPFLTPTGWVEAGRLATGLALATIPTPATEPALVLSEEEARLMGMFVGDGSVSGLGPGKGFNCSITTFSPGVRKEIDRCCEALGLTATDSSARRGRVNISGGSRPMLIRNGLAWTTSHTKRVPAAVFTSPPEVIAAFIAGYWDCDGVVTSRGPDRNGEKRRDVAVELYSVSRDLIGDVQHLLLRLGIRSMIRVKRGTYKNAEHISYRLQIIARDAVARFQHWIRLTNDKRSDALAGHTLPRTDFDALYAPDPIMSVEPNGLQECLCLTVAEDHTFTSDDLVVHNSTLVGEWGPFWWLCNRPTDDIVIASYAADLAETRSKGIRQRIADYGAEYHLVMRPGSRATHDWRLLNGGHLRAVGVGGGLSGFPANLIIVDDPHADRASAESPRVRNGVHDWWSSTAGVRLQPDMGAVIAIMCTAAGMRVLMGDGGWTAIEKVAPGDLVTSLARDGKTLVTSRVLGQRLSGYDDTVTVKTARLTLKVNRAHPFAVLRRDGGFRPNATDVEWVPAGALRPGDVVVTAKSLPADYVGTDVLPDGTPIDQERAWLLGYLVGDGWVTAHKRVRQQEGNPTSYAVCCARTRSKCAGKADLDDRVYAALSSWSTSRVYATTGGYWRTDWAAGGRLLLGMGFGKGARSKRVPKAVWSWPPSLRAAFLLGYAEADGALQRAGREGRRNGGDTWRVVSANVDLLNDTRDLALTCGVRPTTVFSDKPRKYQPPNSPEPFWAVTHSLGLTFNQNTAEGRGLVKGCQHPAPQHLRYERVRTIEPGPVLPVYDLMVEGTESFVAEGYVVHNTRWHEDDFAGRRLKEDGRLEEGGRWKVVHLPAFADPKFGEDPLGREHGAPLTHPKIATRDSARLVSWWQEKKRTSMVRDWHSLFQGDPQPAAGALISSDLLRLLRDTTTEVEPQRVAVAIDPSGGGRDVAGIVGGHLGEDGRLWITDDRSGVMSSDAWSMEAVRLAYDIGAGSFVVEVNFGGDMAVLVLRTAWKTLQDTGEIPAEELCPLIKVVRARQGKLLRAEPIAQQMILDRVRLYGVFTDLEREWATWQPSDPMSPGRIDASVYLAYHLLPIPATGVQFAAPSGTMPTSAMSPLGGGGTVTGLGPLGG